MSSEIQCAIIGLADKVVVDKYYIPVGILHRRFSVEIGNSKDIPLYPTLVNSIENWAFNGSNTLNLATVAAHSSIKATQQIVRDKPVGTLISDGGYMTVKLYTDAARTILFDECPFYSNIYVVSLPDFDSIQEWDFDDGTPQGWTLTDMSISDARKYGATGYSARGYCNVGARQHGAHFWCGSLYKLSKSVSVPNYSHVFGRFMLYMYAYAWHYSGTGYWEAWHRYIKIKFGDDVIFQTIDPMYYATGSGEYNKYGSVPTLNWIPLGFNLDNHRGEVGTLEIEIFPQAHGYGYGSYYNGVGATTEACVDKIVIGAI